MHPDRFLDDLDTKSTHLRELADALDAGEAFRWPAIEPAGRLVLVGMGSSWFAAQVAASRMRRGGITAVAEPASVDGTWPATPDLTVVAISASGGSAETVDFVERHRRARSIALTNTASSRLRDLVGDTVDLRAGVEVSGIACRSELHTLIALLALEEQLTGRSLGLAAGCRAAATAVDHLIGTRDRWLPRAAERLAGPSGTWLVAPAERIASALQGALMIREVPRRQADGCETGDWSHVDVYLTKTLDYRALVFPGSRYDAEAARWMSERLSTAVSVHPDGHAGFPAASLSVTYPASDHPLTALLTETTVPELIAAEWLGSGAAPGAAVT